MPKKKLTAAFIKSLNSAGKRIEYFDTIETGLMLRLYKSGNKTYFYRYRMYDSLKQFKVGSTNTNSLADARKKVRRLKVQIQDGKDPQAQRQAKKNRQQPKTFDDLARLYKEKHLPTLKESTQRTYANRIDSEMIPAFKGMYIKNITRGVIIELLEEIAYARGQHTQSNRVRAILSSMFSWADERQIAEYNPVKAIRPKGNEVQRERVLEESESEIKKLWDAFADIKEPLQSVFKILLLLGQRKGETCRMQWDQIHGDVWTIPEERTKANREHEVPLPPMVFDIIESLENDSPYVFESNRHPGQPVKSLHYSFHKAAKQAGITDVRIHDLRRTAATYMSEMGTDRTVLGKILNHAEHAGDNHVTARYDKYDYMPEKRTALEAWSTKLQNIIAD